MVAAVGPNSMRIAQDLADLVGVRPSVIAALNLHKTLTAACKSAVDLVKVDHSGLMLYHTDYSTGRVCAEFPEDTGAYGIELPLRGVPAQDQLIDGKLPLIVCDTSKASDFGAGQAIFLKFGIRSLVIAPVLGKERVLGSLSLDSNDPSREFSPQDIALCRVSAERIAEAIESAQQMEEAAQKAEQLDALRRAGMAIATQLDRPALFQKILDESLKLLHAKSAGIYEYHPERGELIIVADHERAPGALSSRKCLAKRMTPRARVNEPNLTQPSGDCGRK